MAFAGIRLNRTKVADIFALEGNLTGLRLAVRQDRALVDDIAFGAFNRDRTGLAFCRAGINFSGLLDTLLALEGDGASLCLAGNRDVTAIFDTIFGGFNRYRSAFTVRAGVNFSGLGNTLLALEGNFTCLRLAGNRNLAAIDEFVFGSFNRDRTSFAFC